MSDLRAPQNYQSPYDATSLITHMSGATLTMCICAYIVSSIDGTTIGITSYSSNLTSLPGYPGITFRATTGVTPSKSEHPSGLTAPNMEADLFLVALGLTEADVLAGKWSNAEAVVFVTNYEALNMGQLIIQAGPLAEFRQFGQVLTTEIRGLTQALLHQIGRVVAPLCDADLGDERCGLDLSALGFIKTGTLTGVASQIAFTDSGRSEGASYFDNGILTWTSGNNNGFSFEIDSWNNSTKTFTLRRPTPYMPQAGDMYSAKRGCRKRFNEDCVTTFSNAVNFRGFPHVPTAESLVRLPPQ